MVDGDVVDLDRFRILAKKRLGTPSMLASVGLRLRRIWLHDGQLGQFFIGRYAEREATELPSAASIREFARRDISTAQ